QDGRPAPSPSAEFHPDGARPIAMAAVSADYSQKDFSASDVLDNKTPSTKGWAVAPQQDKRHFLTLTPKAPITIGPGSNLVLRLEQLSKFEYATMSRVRLAKSTDPRA